MSNKGSPPPPSHNHLRSIAAEDVAGVKSGAAASMESSAASDYSLFMNHGNGGHLVRVLIMN